MITRVLTHLDQTEFLRLPAATRGLDSKSSRSQWIRGLQDKIRVHGGSDEKSSEHEECVAHGFRTSTPAQLEAVKKVALDFAFLAGDAKIALADPSYRQHNPTQHKRAQDEGISDFESFKKTFLAAATAGVTGGGGAVASTGPKPPEGNRAEIVLAQCDIVTVIHRIYRLDPTAEPGKFYEAFTFDSYRVKDGKVVEHWDDQVINPPAPAGRAQ